MESSLMNYLLFWVCVVGLCLGSFYNVVILRSLTGESLVFPSSKCPKCGNKLKYWHNIPVISYIFLKGHCAFCKEKISIQYPIIELLTMGLFFLCFRTFGLDWKTLFLIIILSCLLIMSMTDLKEKLVDCNIAIGMGVVGIIYNLIINNAFLDSILGLVIAIILMEVLARLGYLFTDNRAFGEADTYVAGALGACFGLQGLISILFNTLIVSMIFIIPLFLYKQFKSKNLKLILTFFLFILFATLYKFFFVNWIIFSFLVINSIILIILLLKNMKKCETLLYLPLVPAFALATLYYLFF